jgi:hypothetical protein
LASPANIPVVLSSASMLYQTRPGGYQIEIPLQLGMVVNAVFKNQNWLYVQTPHGEEGYISYDSCLPLGILPVNQRCDKTTTTILTNNLHFMWLFSIFSLDPAQIAVHHHVGKQTAISFPIHVEI